MSTLKKVLFWLWLLLGLAACGVATTYAELNDARDAATTDEERAELDDRIERIERQVVAAEVYFERRASCRTTNNVWFCYPQTERFNERKPPQTIDEIVRVYRHDKHNCRCVSQADMRNVLERMR